MGSWLTSWYVFLPLLAIMAIFVRFKTVRTGSIQAAFLFGRFYRILYPGLNIIPRWIVKTERISTGTHQDEFPDEPQYIDRINEIPEPGKVKPTRINHKGMQEAIFYVDVLGDIPNKPDWPLDRYRAVRFHELHPEVRQSLAADSRHAPLVSEVPFVVEWELNTRSPGNVENYVRYVVPEDGRTRDEEVTKRMGDMISHLLQSLLGPVTMGHAIDMMKPFGFYIQNELEIMVGEKEGLIPDHGRRPWGIHIVTGYMKEPYPGHTVAKALADAAASTSNKETKIRDAEAESASTRLKADANKYQQEREAEAAAYTERQKGIGEGDRIKEMAERMKTPEAKFLATLDVAETALSKGKTIFVPTGTGILASVLGLAADLAKEESPSSSEPPSPQTAPPNTI